MTYFKKHTLRRYALASLPILSILTVAQGCQADPDYDLTKEIDKEMEFGGELVLPACSVAPYSIGKMLSLSEGADSPLQPNGEKYGLAKGDYVIVQDGAVTKTSFAISPVTITNLTPATGGATISFPSVPANISQLVRAITVTLGNGTSTSQWEKQIAPITSTVSLSHSGVDAALVSMERAGTDIAGTLKLGVNINGQAYPATIRSGFKIEFDPSVTLSLPQSVTGVAASANVLTFTADKDISASSPLSIPLTISAIDCTKLPAGEGLSNGKFTYNGTVTALGTIEALTTSLPSGNVDMTVSTSFAISRATINSITGRINPKINIAATSFDLGSNIPNFMRDEKTRLDIANPQVYLTVTNGSPATVNTSLTLCPITDGRQGTPLTVSGITLLPGANIICLSSTGSANMPASANIKVDGLSSLIASIPDRIEVSDITAQIAPATVTLDLTKNYDVAIHTKVVAPLSFGPSLSFEYSDSNTGWDADLGDYTFRRVKVCVTAVNTVPITMRPSAEAIFKSADHKGSVNIAVNGEIAAGSLQNPAESTFEIDITANDGSLAGLDGLAYRFLANRPLEGVVLNSGQSLTLKRVQLTVAGGVVVDLNK